MRRTRQQKRHETLIALADSAVAAFEELGPTATMDVIAERAGVSRRTAFRYVESKEDLVFVHPRLWLKIFEVGLVAGRQPGSSLGERLFAAGMQVAAHIDDAPDAPRRAFMVTLKHPRLFKAYPAMQQLWIARLSEEALHDSVSTDDRFRARVIAGAFMGMIDAALSEWLAAGGQLTFAAAFQQGFVVLAPLLGSCVPDVA